MKEGTILKGIFAVITTGLTIYFKALAIPILVLICFMALDYLTGMTSAWINNQLNSRIGAIGIIKKVSYLVTIIVAMGIDYLLYEGLSSVGITYNLNYLMGMLVTVWFILNELISILENVAKINSNNVPPFLQKILDKLKTNVENKATDKVKEKE